MFCSFLVVHIDHPLSRRSTMLQVWDLKALIFKCSPKVSWQTFLSIFCKARNHLCKAHAPSNFQGFIVKKFWDYGTKHQKKYQSKIRCLDLDSSPVQTYTCFCYGVANLKLWQWKAPCPHPSIHWGTLQKQSGVKTMMYGYKRLADQKLKIDTFYSKLTKLTLCRF